MESHLAQSARAGKTPAPDKPFWEAKTIGQMTQAEWESLCDGCGKCCFLMVQEMGTGKRYETNVACRLLDTKTRLCSAYGTRLAKVRECFQLKPGRPGSLDWLPETCAYRRLQRGEGLPDWHPLLGGSRKDVMDAVPIPANPVSEEHAKPDIFDHAIAVRARPRRISKQKRRPKHVR